MKCTYQIFPRTSVGNFDFDMNGTAASPSMYPCFHGSNISKKRSERAFSVGVIAQLQVAVASGATLLEIGEDGGEENDGNSRLEALATGVVALGVRRRIEGLGVDRGGRLGGDGSSRM